MKVFLVSTPIGEQKLGDLFKRLYDEIEHLGYQHVSNFIMMHTIEFVEKMKGKDAQKDFYKDMTESISKADICIFEASTPSFGVGYLIQASLNNSKPTIVLFHENMKSNLLPGIEDEKLIVKVYDEKNYKRVLKSSLSVAREKRDKRFNFFLSPKLLTYLENESKEQGVTKSKILRDLILGHMRQKQAGKITELVK